MVDLAKVVEYERGFPVELTYPPGHPKAGKKIGITWWMMHQDSAPVKRVIGRHVKADRAIAAIKINGSDAPDLPDEVYLDREYEKLAAAVERWDWGEHTFNGEPAGDCTYDRALAVLKSATWIFGQIYDASANLGNFTEASAKI